MSGQFNGFTQADIRKVAANQKQNIQGKSIGPKSVLKKKLPDQGENAEAQKNIKIPTAIEGPLDTTGDSSLASLRNAFKDAMEFKPPADRLEEEENKETSDKHNEIDSAHKNDNSNECVDENEEEKIIPFKGMSLKDYEARNRMVKEQNRIKKEMLCKAIEQHSERTAAETRKLKEIKFELSRLENELVADVSLLRKEIESASIRYMNTQKYYLQIESAFLKAKLDLHEAKEKKEMLAEHLNIIIASNEERKAKKLAELMDKVGLTQNDTDL